MNEAETRAEVIDPAFFRFGLILLPDIGDSDPQAYQQPDSPFGIVLIAIWKIILFPEWALELICKETGINSWGIIRNFLFIAPGLFWASLVELLFAAKKQLWPDKPEDKIISH
jgi:hypothetical protein